MIKNYIKIAWRNLLKNKGYSFINILGLATGMAVAIMIGLWINDELSHNDYHNNKATIAQMYQSQTFNGQTGTGPAIPRPLEFELRQNYADYFKRLVMSSWNNRVYLKVGDKSLSRPGNFMQEDGPALLDLKMIRGDHKALKEVNALMLSESLANDLFGLEDPIGKMVTINNQGDLMVTGVYKDIPENNSFRDLHYIGNWEMMLQTYEWMRNAEDQWGNNSFQLFVQIPENTTIESVSAVIRNAKKKVAGEDIEVFNPQLMLLPMKDWHLRNHFENGVQTGGRIENVWMFGVIGVFVLLLACINFINLSTARSEKRATEVGIRKSIGSNRSQLIAQFLSESFIVVVLAFVLAIGMVLLFLNGFNELASKVIVFPWTNMHFWLYALVFIVFTALVSGSYPALYLSSFNPVTVLKGTFKAGRFSALPRQILVVMQFTFSVALIIGTMVVMNQIQFSKNRPVGYSKNGLIQLPVMSPDFEGKADMMRSQFIESGAVVNMSTSSSPTTQVWSNRSGYLWEGKPEGFQEDFAYTSVSYEFAETMDVEIIDGRGFSRDFASDSSAVILNETAVKYMGIKDPVGKLIRDSDTDDPAPPLKIIGVIKDMIVQSAYEPVKQAMYVFDRDENASYYNLRLNPDKSVSESISQVENIFKTNFPSIPFDYQFVDEEYGRKFVAEERIASLAKVFTILAIFISCLGLFGLASFVAEQRTKEIGVRKVLGASIRQLWLLLSKDFILLVIISILVASPLAYYVMEQWLLKFSYRTPIGWEVFAIACIGALVITLITVSFQAVRAALVNPVKSLRTE